jgi:iron complex transport system substrate-binding protein
VATLLPYVAEALTRVPEGVVVVAAVAPREGGSPVAGAADLGNPHAPDLEGLARARPDLVVADARLHGALSDALARSGARVLLVSGDSVDGTLDGLAEVGRAAGVEAAMAGLLAETRRLLAAVPRPERLAVLPLFGSPGSSFAITRGTWLGDLLARLGFVNLAGGLGGGETVPGYVPLADEWLATQSPDLVVFVAHGDPTGVVEGFRRRRWGGGGALPAAALQVLDPDLFGANPGLRLPAAARRLVELAAGVEAAAR